MTAQLTSYDDLYAAYGALIKEATGRDWWRKKGIQSRPQKPYATVFFNQAEELENQFVELVATGDDPAYYQLPRGASLIDVEIAFYGDRTNDTAETAAAKLRSALYLDLRYRDIYAISSLAGHIQTLDLSMIFREDVESRVELRFQIYANVTYPVPTDNTVPDIHEQPIEIIHIKIDDVETDLNVDITDNSD